MGHVCLSYKSYFFSKRIVFSSHHKSANSTFSHDLSAKRTGPMCSYSKLSRSRVFSKPAMTYQPSELDICVHTQNCLEVECSLNSKP
jgi:hypothetical protein